MIFYQAKSHLCSTMSKQPIQLLLVKIELLNNVIALCKFQIVSDTNYPYIVFFYDFIAIEGIWLCIFVTS